MKTSNQPRTVLLLAALAMAISIFTAAPAGATDIAIPNPSFETQAKVEGSDNYNQWASTADVWRQWARTENGGPLRIWNPGVDGTIVSSGQNVLVYGFGGSAPDGNNVVLVRSRYADVATVVPPQWDGVNYFSAAAQLLDTSLPAYTAQFDPTKVYTMTATVGKPIVFQSGYTNGTPRYATDPSRPQSAVWFGYALQLAVGGTNMSGATYGGYVTGGTVVAQDANSVSINVDQYGNVRATFIPNPADPALAALAGQYLQIRLCALDNPADLAMTGHVVFDNVKLESFTAPTQAYWDRNDTAAGSGGPTPNGTWDVANAYWNTDSTGGGGGSISSWTPGQTAVFSAGTDATGTYTVTVDGLHAIGGLTFKDGSVTLANGTSGGLQLTGIATVDVAAALTATIQTPISDDGFTARQLVKTGAGTLVLSAANTYSGGTMVLDGTLRLGASNVLDDTSIVTVNGRSAGTTTFDLAGNSETVGGLVLGGSTATSAAVVSTGAGTLTLGGNVSYVNASGTGGNPLGATISGKLDLGAMPRTFLVNDSATAAADLTVSADISGSVLMTKAGRGTLVLSGNNAAATGGMSLTEGVTQFESPASINGTARDVTVTTPGAVVFGASFGAANIPTALLNRIVATSDGIIAADNYAATNFEFNAAGLTAAYLGAVGNVTYTGILTPNGTTYRLGGGGGTLTIAGTNALTGGANSVVIGGKVTLTDANNYGGGTTLLGGTVFPAGPVVLSIGNDSALGTGSLTFQAQPNSTGTGVIQSTDSTARTLANAIVLAGAVNIGGTGDMTFSNTAATDLPAAYTFTINNPTTTFGQSFGGLGGISKAGTGTMILTGNNTYAGTTTVSAGTLVLSGTNTLPGLITASGGTLNISGDHSACTGGLTLSGSVLNLNSATALGTGTLTLSGGTINVPSGPITVSTNPPVTLGGNFTFGGSNALDLGTGAVNNSGNRTLTLNGNNPLTLGPMINTQNAATTLTVNKGTGTGSNTALNLASYALTGGTNTAARTTTIAGNANVNILGDVTDGQALANALTYSGTGRLTVSGANSYTGATTLSGPGTLVLDYSSQDNSKLSDTAALTLSGGTLTLNGGTHTEIVSATTLNTAGTFLTRSGSGTGTLRMNAITRAAGGTIAFADTTIADTDTNNSGTSGANGILGGWATIGNDWASSANTGAADTPITALAAYTAFATTGGASTTNFLLNGASSLTGALAANTLKITNSADSQTLDLVGNNLTVTSASATNLGGIMYAGGNDNIYSITGTGRIVTSTANQEIIFAVNTGTLTVSAFVGASGSTGSVTKSGGGTLEIGSANNYTGATRVNEGVLRLSDATASGTVAGGITVRNGAALELANNIAVGAEALTLIGTGVSSGGALRNVAGSTSTYGGAVTIGAGGARINSDAGGALTLTSTITTAAGQNATVGGAGNVRAQGVISGGGTLIKDGTGILTVTAANTYSGGTSVQNGALTYATTTSKPTSGTTTVAAGATLGLGVGVGLFGQTDVNSLFAGSMANVSNNSLSNVGIDTTAADFDYASSVASTRGLNKLGANTLTLSGNNTYTGTTYVTAGTLKLAPATGSALPDGAAVQNNAAFEIAAAGQTAGAITGSGSTTVIGGAGLTANSIVQDTLTIGASGSVTIREVSLAASSANAVPEPGTWVLIGTALVGWLALRRRR